jgi:regulator of replication initiation timing
MTTTTSYTDEQVLTALFMDGAGLLIASDVRNIVKSLLADRQRLQAENDAYKKAWSEASAEVFSLQAEVEALRWLPDESKDKWAPGDHYNDGEHNGYINGWDACRDSIISHRANQNETKEAKS